MADLLTQITRALAPTYQVERPLGAGGMAMVYLATDVQHQRRVAVKVLREELAGAVGQDRFLREIRIAAELNHPHILPLLDSGTAVLDQIRLPYYVMPFMEGESLRQRLDREGPLPLPDVRSIARDVSAALTHAHSRGIVHRDIKPENILLTGREAVVADFGIARAIDRSADPELVTSAGLAIGTPTYMSPEQGVAQAELDGRADLYALGCVVYEMLTGDPPFSGTSPQAVIARHRVDPVPPIRTARPTVPPVLEAAVLRALEKLPADRFSSAEQFAVALGTGDTPTRPVVVSSRTSRARLLGGIAAAAGMALLGWYALAAGDLANGNRDSGTLDTTLVAVLPARPDTALALGPSLMLQDAMAQWSGIQLVNQLQIRDAMTRRPQGGALEWAQLAAELGAGRYVLVDGTPIGDSIRVHAVLFDTRTRNQLTDQSLWIGSDFADSRPRYQAIAESLLFRGGIPPANFAGHRGTLSAPARQAFAGGYAALSRWDLAAADSAFDAAGRFDPDYAEAHLWLAVTRAWAGADPVTWRPAAERAGAGRRGLSRRDQVIADAVLAQARGDFGPACAHWERLTRTDPHDFAAWYGSADCQARDDAIFPDARSVSGWRFRSSYHSALLAYQRAFELLPSIHRALQAGSFLAVRNLFKTGSTELRAGSPGPPDTGLFASYAALDHDTLAFIPYPIARLSEARRRNTSAAEALQYRRRLFHQVARTWVAEFPRSPAALEALAVSLDLLGSPTAIDTFRLARSLSTDPDERLRLGAAEVWIRVKQAVPGNLAGLRAARTLADSLLRSRGSSETRQPRIAAGLAILLGRGHLAASLSHHPRFQADWQTPPALTTSGPALLIYSALGGPAESLAVLELRADRAIESGVAPSDRQRERLTWLARGATLAFPDHRFVSLPRLTGQGDYLVDAVAAAVAGNRAEVRRVLDDQRRTREYVGPVDRSLEGLLPEAGLWAWLGEPEEAVRWMDPTLNLLPAAAPGIADEPLTAAVLLRIMALRSRLAASLGDTTGARAWATALATLWSEPERFLQPAVDELRGVMRTPPTGRVP